MEMNVDCLAQHSTRFGLRSSDSLLTGMLSSNVDCRARHSTNSGRKFGDSRNSNVELNVDCLARH